MLFGYVHEAVKLVAPFFILIYQSEDLDEYEPVLANEIRDEKYGEDQSHDFDEVADIYFLSDEDSVYVNILSFLWII